MNEPNIFNVNYNLSAEFVQRVNSEANCKIEKVIEILTCKILQYWISCPKEKEAAISDYAFMTWIKNPVFQKYYHGSEAFEKIKNDYIKSRENDAQ